MARRHTIQRVAVTWYGDEFLSIVQKGGPEAMFAAGEVLEQAARGKAPTGRRGNLRRSAYIGTIRRSTFVQRRYWRREVKAKGPLDVVVAFSAPHAHLLEAGRRKVTEIRPKRKKALHIGDALRARAQGSRMGARPFVGPAIEATRETMVRELCGVLGRKLSAEMPHG